MSIFIFFSNLIPWLLFQTSLIGFFGDSLLFPSRNHNVFAFGKSIFLLFVTQPVSIKYPSLNFFGFNKIILSFPLSVLVYFLKVKSSIVAPIKEIDPNWSHPILKKNAGILINQLSKNSRIEITRLRKSVII